MPVCEVCFRKCKIEEGKKGFCGSRTCRKGKIEASNYGRITAAALDPIEKKPLKMFRPGTRILSLGSYGCNLRCPFCQNSDISWSEKILEHEKHAERFSPEEIIGKALELKSSGNIGLAFTYNEPLVGYEFVRDTAKLSKQAGLENVLVTNGTASLKVLKEISCFIDAMNIDLKSFSNEFYTDFAGGNLEMTKAFIESAAETCHVELTTLIIPNKNDGEEEMLKLSSWIHTVETRSNKKIPLHITRFFPRFKMQDSSPTPVSKIYSLVELARQNLDYVFPGNV
ncbi:MAG: AmmeMemoRadiSam system radical SAM enzyme [Treponema sp.]|nr:AmmeMemoRadiSam system radical SAM enzyme [Treponema sp.]